MMKLSINKSELKDKCLIFDNNKLVFSLFASTPDWEIQECLIEIETELTTDNKYEIGIILDDEYKVIKGTKIKNLEITECVQLPGLLKKCNFEGSLKL